MVCKECLLDDVQYNEATGQCYCPNCRKVWIAKKYSYHNVPLVLHSILSLLSFIFPIGFLITFICMKVRVKKSYVSLYSVNAILSILFIFVMLGGLYCYGLDTKEEFLSVYEEATQTLCEKVLFSQDVNRELAQQVDYKEKIIEEKLKEKELKEKIEEQNMFIKSLGLEGNDSTLLDYLDGTILSGIKVKELLDNVKDSNNFSILLRTKLLSKKYGEEYYACYLMSPSSAGLINETQIQPFVEIKKEKDFKNLDFTDYSINEYSNFSNSKTIFYIADSSKFEVRIRQFDDVVCIKLTEDFKDD